MNLNLITGFVVGGLLLLSVLAFNNSVFNSAVETVTGVMTEDRIGTIVEIMQNDIQRLGYNTGTTDNFILIEEDHVKFKGDIFDGDEGSSTVEFNTVEWELTDSEASSTPNPDDYILTRTFDPDPFVVGDEEQTEFYVTNFELQYFNANGAVATGMETVKQIEVEIIYESPEPYATGSNNSSSYYRSVWKRTIVPNNLTF